MIKVYGMYTYNNPAPIAQYCRPSLQFGYYVLHSMPLHNVTVKKKTCINNTIPPFSPSFLPRGAHAPLPSKGHDRLSSEGHHSFQGADPSEGCGTSQRVVGLPSEGHDSPSEGGMDSLRGAQFPFEQIRVYRSCMAKN